MKNTLLYSFSLIVIMSLMACHSSSKAQSNTSLKDSAPFKSDNVLSNAQKKEGWKLLFDGKSTKGWRTFGQESTGSAWQVQDGKLIFTPTKDKDGRGDLITEEQFENFHLKVDWKISDCGNSGIIFNVQEEGQTKTYHTGPEMQILDDTCHADAQYPTHRAGSLYDLIQALPETVKPAGEWNTAEIVLNDGHLIFRLNGTQVVETQLFNDDWDKMIANSKFKRWSGFGTFRKGHIAFQDHGDVVEFKNIIIKEL